MSSVYSLEPATKGKVTLITTLGDIEIELWPKETPKACRNFVQLCMEKYYDDCIFHRIVKDFIVQTGDPTGTGDGGESIYGEPFPIETHSRLKFNHRGVVAMANAGTGKNGSQFFITIAQNAEHLNGKNTIFGKVVGNTIYNVVNMNEYQVDENNFPLFPPKIIRADVVWNPYEDIVPRVHVGKKRKPEDLITEQRRAKIAKTAKKDLSVLSFGDDAEDDEEESVVIKKNDVTPARKLTGERNATTSATSKSHVHSQTKEKDNDEKPLPSESKIRSKAEELERKMREQLEQTRNKFEPAEKKEAVPKDEDSSKIAESKAEKKSKKQEKKQAILMLEEERMKYLKKNATRSDRQKKTLERLQAFQSNLRKQLQTTKNPPASSSEQNDGGNDKIEESTASELMYDKDYDSLSAADEKPDWMTNRLKFNTPIKDPQMDNYVVLDPLKGKTIETAHQKHKRQLSGAKKTEKW